MIVTFGSINLDLIFPLRALPALGETVLTASAQVQPGGKGANQAVAAARDGAQTVFVGAVGADALADGALIGFAGIDTSRIARIEGVATGCAAVLLDANGGNAIAVGSGANLHVKADQVEAKLLGPGTTLLLQMEVPAEETAALIARARARRSRIVLNLAPALPLPKAAITAVDVLVVNETEAETVAGWFGCAPEAAALRSATGTVVVRTLGGDGVEYADVNGRTHLPAQPIVPVDTTAAGDCFTGVLAAALSRGNTMAEAVRRANTAAAIACSRAGSQVSLPTSAEIDAALAAGGA